MPEYFLCVEDKLTVNFLHKFLIFLKEEMDSFALVVVVKARDC